MEHRSPAMFSACVATSAVLSMALTGCGGDSTTMTPATPHTYDLSIDMCSSSGCFPSAKRVALDTADNPTKGDFVTVSGGSLTLEYKENVGGPRVYLIEEDGTNKNVMFDLAGKEFSFDVELSTMTCGFNAALYFVGMDKNEGGAESGSKYCDAQAVAGTFCSEMDIFEGNTAANVFTTHSCIDECASYSEGSNCQCASDCTNNEICDHSGCGINPFRHGPNSSYNDAFYGQGSFSIDTSQSFTVTTQFHDNKVERFYIQNGNRIDLPTLYVMPNDGPFVNPKITDEYCGWSYDSWNGSAGLTPGAELTPAGQMFKNFENGMVLTMSAWYDKETAGGGGMSWMDGNNSWGKVGPCNTTTSDSGSHQVMFSKIRFGDINTTTPTELAASAPTAQPSPHGVLV